MQVSRVRIPRRDVSPAAVLGRRLVMALALVLFVSMVAFFGRDGYEDAKGDGVSLLDCVYYATVSITTTGYGDVRPESDGARLATVLLVTPARVLFLLLLVGTTVELLAERGRDAFRVAIWRRRLKDHVIVCGYGSKGRSAVKTLVAKGFDRDRIVVIDQRPGALAVAEEDGLTAVNGDATRVEVLHEAMVHQARSIVVAPDRDDTAVLVTLTAREHNPAATIVAAAREDENVHLLKQSGATTVITSSSASGRLLGFATVEPRVVEVLEDIMSVGHGIDISQREVTPEEIGQLERLPLGEPIVAVVRGDRLLRFDDPEAARLQAGDRLVYLCANPEPAPTEPE